MAKAKVYKIINKNGSEVIFIGLQNLADEIGIPLSTLHSRLHTMSFQEAYDMGVLNERWSAKIILKNGEEKTFLKQKDLATEIGIDITTLEGRLRRMNPQQAYDMKEKKNKCHATIKLQDCTEKEFKKQQDLADEIGIKRVTLVMRLKRMTAQEAYDMG